MIQCTARHSGICDCRIPGRTVNVLTGLCSGIEKTINMSVGRVSSFFTPITRVRQACGLALSLFNTFKDWVPGKVVNQSGTSVGSNRVSDLVSADESAIFAESLEALAMVLEALHKETVLLALKVFLAKPKVQMF